MATLVDFSRAFDGIWKYGLYHKMEEKGIPMHMIRWVRGFLNERIAAVRYGDPTSSYRKMAAGIPQGTVLGPPPIYHLYIADCANAPCPPYKKSLFEPF